MITAILIGSAAAVALIYAARLVGDLRTRRTAYRLTRDISMLSHLLLRSARVAPDSAPTGHHPDWWRPL